MNPFNDFAIELAKKLESEIVRQFYNNKEVPNFYNIRQILCDELRKYIKVAFVEEAQSPEMIMQMSDEIFKDYANHIKKKQAAQLATMAMDEGLAFKDTFEDQYLRYKKITTMMAFVNLNALCDNTMGGK